MRIHNLFCWFSGYIQGSCRYLGLFYKHICLCIHRAFLWMFRALLRIFRALLRVSAAREGYNNRHHRRELYCWFLHQSSLKVHICILNRYYWPYVLFDYCWLRLLLFIYTWWRVLWKSWASSPICVTRMLSGILVSVISANYGRRFDSV